MYNFSQLKKSEKQMLEKEQITMELALLRAKIDPHFLFNSINNIDVLINSKPKKASEFLKKLGEILRFVLYRTDEERISLNEEIACIEKYIELQKIRSVNERFVDFEISGNPEGRFIAPMILIPFVENAMKFVADRKQDNAINVSLKVFKDYIIFKIVNTVRKGSLGTYESSGIGLKTIKQRLSLLYFGKHSLSIFTDEEFFKVELQIIDE